MPPSETRPDNPGPRQAVVLIHGIGEQRPMDTLRAFVAALLQDGSYHSKPDTLSDSYELRRLKLRRASKDHGATEDVNLEWPETDFYEYYWAHQMYGTKVSHVVSWASRTLARGAGILKTKDADWARLRHLAVAAWLLTLGAFGAFVWGVANPSVLVAGATTGLGFTLLVLLAVPPLRYLIFRGALDVVGDAARYFDVNPQNVARRYDILRGGIALLEKLHTERDECGDLVKYRYGRIVLVGHSLGSVIAYDILRHYWAEVNGRIEVDSIDAAVAEVEKFRDPRAEPRDPNCGEERSADPRGFWLAQHALWTAISGRVPAGREFAKAKVQARWIVSDLVTMGSPLAHAPVLVTNGPEDLCSKIRLRELPTCPPDRSRHVKPGRIVVPLDQEAERFVAYQIIHHAAHFALTRWTNFWRPNDPVGGPVAPSFGSGVQDVLLPNISLSPLASHVGYWRRKEEECVRRLKGILVGASGDPSAIA